MTLLNSLKSLKSFCNTRSKRLLFNELVKSFDEDSIEESSNISVVDKSELLNILKSNNDIQVAIGELKNISVEVPFHSSDNTYQGNTLISKKKWEHDSQLSPALVIGEDVNGDPYIAETLYNRTKNYITGFGLSVRKNKKGNYVKQDPGGYSVKVGYAGFVKFIKEYLF